MERMTVLIDGFNLYHSAKSAVDHEAEGPHHQDQEHYCWT